jgi:Tfp pilus assembly protein FimT
MAKNKTGYSVIELIIFVLFLGIFAAMTVPKMTFFIISKQKAETFANQVVTDLRRTRRLAISDAATNTNGYALNMTGGSPYTGYEIVNLNTSTIITNGTFSIDSDISVTSGTNFQFGPLGNLKAGSDTQLIVSAEGKTFTITITSATGMVKCVES